MKLKKLPIGIQTFSKIRTENYVYIDKTKEAFELIDKYSFVFLSRPRRFGKSLFLDTLHCIFEGKKELFEGLYIYDKYDWSESYPVIKISFAGNFDTEENILQSFVDIIKYNENLLGVTCKKNSSPSSMLNNLILKVSEKYNQEIVILIDEYDKMLLDNIIDLEMADYARKSLKGFYEVIKNNSNLIKFAFLTGVSKFSKVSVFSGLNNLIDVSLMEQFGNICGYTHNDIETTLKPYLEGVDLEELKRWYNGYYFLKDKVYNPYDVLLFIENNHEFQEYWFETGTPTFLVELIKNNNYYMPDIENIIVERKDFNSFNHNKINIGMLLLQTGYLTINERLKSPLGGYLYSLKIPNNEVRQSFNSSILTMMIDDNSDSMLRVKTLEALMKGDLDTFENLLKTLFSSIAYENYTNNNIQKYEGLYAIIIYVFLSSLGIKVQTESSTNKGRMDMLIELKNKVYIMEFKVTQESALEQIKAKNYTAKFLNQNKEIYLVGINFDPKARNIANFEYERQIEG